MQILIFVTGSVYIVCRDYFMLLELKQYLIDIDCLGCGLFFKFLLVKTWVKEELPVVSHTSLLFWDTTWMLSIIINNAFNNNNNKRKQLQYQYI